MADREPHHALRFEGKQQLIAHLGHGPRHFIAEMGGLGVRLGQNEIDVGAVILSRSLDVNGISNGSGFANFQPPQRFAVTAPGDGVGILVIQAEGRAVGVFQVPA